MATAEGLANTAFMLTIGLLSKLVASGVFSREEIQELLESGIAQLPADNPFARETREMFEKLCVVYQSKPATSH